MRLARPTQRSSLASTANLDEDTVNVGGEDLKAVGRSDMYEAYQFAGGPYCGEDSLGDTVECEAGHSCSSVLGNTCSQ